MAFTYLISERAIKEYSPLDGNVDQKIIKPLIRDAQEIYIHSRLGTDLYNKLIADVQAFETSSTPIPSPYDVLLNTFVMNILMFRVLADVPDFISLKMRNNGVIKQGNSNGQAGQIIDYQRLSDKFEAKARAWEARLDMWLCEKQDDLPEYTDNTDDGDVHPQKARHVGGLYLG